MPKPLIPDDVRALYEELIASGPKIMASDDPLWTDPTVVGLLGSGLANIIPRRPPMLAPVSPDAAFENMLARWARPIASWHDRFDDTLRESARLHHDAIRSGLRLGLGSRPIVLADPWHVTSLHVALSVAAKSLARSCSTGPYGETATLPNGDPHPADNLYFDTDLAARGGRFLILCDESYAAEYPDDLVDGHAAGEEIRVSAKTLPMKLLVVDDHTALVPLAPYGHPCLLVRDPTLIAVFTDFFDKLWDKSTPWSPEGASATANESSTRRDVLSALSSGLKDEAIARHLGISARTVRRHVAQIMRDLGATTRFAAGVAAVRQGLVAKGAA